jgi:hypothetical protein
VDPGVVAPVAVDVAEIAPSADAVAVGLACRKVEAGEDLSVSEVQRAKREGCLHQRSR